MKVLLIMLLMIDFGICASSCLPGNLDSLTVASFHHYKDLCTKGERCSRMVGQGEHDLRELDCCDVYPIAERVSTASLLSRLGDTLPNSRVPMKGAIRFLQGFFERQWRIHRSGSRFGPPKCMFSGTTPTPLAFSARNSMPAT